VGSSALRGRAPAPMPVPGPGLRILFLVTAHNSLSQRAQVALTELGHEVSVAVVDSGPAMEAAVEVHRPELIVCPFLTKIIPESVYSKHRCLVVHPGPVGDRGPSSLDWAIELGMGEWGVTVLEATGEVDGGDIWGTRKFPTRAVGKSSLYRHEVRRGAVEALVEAVGGVNDPGFSPTPLDYDDPHVTGRPLPMLSQAERSIDWSSDASARILRKVRAAEGNPGVLDRIGDVEFHLFGAHAERALRGTPGAIIAQRGGAICRATVDGAVWITHLKRRDEATQKFFKLPATRALALSGQEVDVPEVPAPLHAPVADVAIVSAVIELGHALNTSSGTCRQPVATAPRASSSPGRSTRTSSTSSWSRPLSHRRRRPPRPLASRAAPLSGRRPQPEARAAPGVVRGSAARQGRPPRARSCPSRTRR